MIELTLEQRNLVARETEKPPRAIDPDTSMTYVLIPESQYARLENLLVAQQDAAFSQDAYLEAMEVFGREGWNDRSMDIYDELDPRRAQ